MKIKFFGKLTDIFKDTEFEFDTKEIHTVSVLRSKLEEGLEELKGKTYIVVVNGKKGDDETEIFENSEIALLPPYSGG